MLEDTYEILLEESEDITYRMYDLFFQKYPELMSKFPCAREKHPPVVVNLLCEFAQRSEGSTNIRINCGPMLNDKERLQCIEPEHLPLFKSCLLGAIKDILYDAATPAMLKAWSDAYDCLTGELTKNNVVQLNKRQANA